MHLISLFAFSVMAWLHRLGAVGLFLVAIIDNSFIPIPGGVDIFTILLVSGHRQMWWMYAAVATASSVFGGWLTFRIARTGGEEALEKKIGKKRAEKVYKKFKEHAFSTIVIGAILPPPHSSLSYGARSFELSDPQLPICSDSVAAFVIRRSLIWHMSMARPSAASSRHIARRCCMCCLCSRRSVGLQPLSTSNTTGQNAGKKNAEPENPSKSYRYQARATRS
jgi:membrane protein YqaA with SNARE-associated domain